MVVCFLVLDWMTGGAHDTRTFFFFFIDNIDISVVVLTGPELCLSIPSIASTHGLDIHIYANTNTTYIHQKARHIALGNSIFFSIAPISAHLIIQ